MPFDGTTENGQFRNFHMGDLIYGLAGGFAMGGPRVQPTRYLAENTGMNFSSIQSELPYIDKFYDLSADKYCPNQGVADAITSKQLEDASETNPHAREERRESFKKFILQRSQFYPHSEEKFYQLKIGYSQYDNKLNEYLWRKKSKGGISWVIHYTPGHVHFCLHGLDMLQVVGKSHNRDVPSGHSDVKLEVKQRSITGAELRWIFRNRNNSLVKARIQFWNIIDGEDGFKAVIPPWETPEHILIWKGYDEGIYTRALKHSGKYDFFQDNDDLT